MVYLRIMDKLVTREDKNDGDTASILEGIIKAVSRGGLALVVMHQLAGDPAVAAVGKKGYEGATSVTCKKPIEPFYGIEGIRRTTRIEIPEGIIKLVAEKVQGRRSSDSVKIVLKFLANLEAGNLDVEDVPKIWKTISDSVELWQEDGGVTFNLVMFGLDKSDANKLVGNYAGAERTHTGVGLAASCDFLWSKGMVSDWMNPEDKKGIKGAAVPLLIGDIGKPGKGSDGVGAKFELSNKILKKRVPLFLKIDIRGLSESLMWEIVPQRSRRGVVLKIGEPFNQSKVNSIGVWGN